MGADDGPPSSWTYGNEGMERTAHNQGSVVAGCIVGGFADLVVTILVVLRVDVNEKSREKDALFALELMLPAQLWWRVEWRTRCWC